jgi:Cdc6-like AAA superfamily ATPase
MMRNTNYKQRELILEFIHRLHDPSAEAIQIYLGGPAGCGKSYVLGLIMETLNRYTPKEKNRLRNAYVACVSTGKAVAALQGTTAHSAFRISAMRAAERPLSNELEQTYRRIRPTKGEGLILAIDSNARSKIWSDTYTNARGRMEENIITRDVFIMKVDTDVPSFQRRRGRSWIDITLCTAY